MSVFKKLCAVITISFFLLVFGWVVYHQATEKPNFAMANPTVSAAFVMEEEVRSSISAVGTLQAYQGVNLTAKDSAVITHIYFPSNASIDAGSVVMEQDTAVKTAVLKQARVELTLAESNYQRAANLYKKHYMSQQSFDETKEKYLYAQATHNKAKAELNQRMIVSPFSGKLGLIKVQAGDYVTQGDSLVTLTNLNQLYVDFFISERYINQVKKGDVVQIKSAIDSNRIITARVDVLENVINKDTYMLRVRAKINNEDHFLKPGGFVNVTVYFGRQKKLFTVPQTAIRYANTGNYVYKIVNDTVHQTPVTLGSQIGEMIVVLSGLKQGDQVVSIGVNKVHDGQTVNLSESM
jgi:membrane fusion protein (multidrug efflux system)